MVKTCKECGTSFEITEKNAKWFTDNHLKLPERCEACRKKRKEAKMMAKESKR